MRSFLCSDRRVVGRGDPALVAQRALPFFQGRRWPHCSQPNHDDPRLQRDHPGCQDIRFVFQMRFIFTVILFSRDPHYGTSCNPSVFQVNPLCAVGKFCVRTSVCCVRPWEDADRTLTMMSHPFLKRMSLLRHVETNSQRRRPHRAPQRNTQNKTTNMTLIKHLYPKRSQTRTIQRQLPQRRRRMNAAGTGFRTRPTTFWTDCWTWTLPRGSQQLTPYCTRSLETFSKQKELLE